MISVFTDGACSNNGKPNAKAGIGVYFNKGNPRNISKRVIGKQSNNTAELSAIIEVFDICLDEIINGIKIIIYSDSEYSIRCCGEYGLKCSKNGYRNRTGYIPNHELVKKVYECFEANKNVEIKHIKAHTGLTDELSLGNEGADKLANESIGSESCPYQKHKYYFHIPYSEKEVGKKYGTKWDVKKKKWYYEGFNTDNNFKSLINLFPL